MTCIFVLFQFPYRTPILTHHAALVKFTNPFLTAINGLLTVTGSSMMEGNELLRYGSLVIYYLLVTLNCLFVLCK